MLLGRNRLGALHPDLASAIQAMADALPFDILLASGFRSFAEQDALYAQGHTAPGDVVTRARAGESAHNFGLAGDVTPNVSPLPPNTDPRWQAIGEAAKAAGLKWGGSWTSFRGDFSHVELPDWASLKDWRAVRRFR